MKTWIVLWVLGVLLAIGAFVAGYATRPAPEPASELPDYLQELKRDSEHGENVSPLGGADPLVNRAAPSRSSGVLADYPAFPRVYSPSQRLMLYEAAQEIMAENATPESMEAVAVLTQAGAVVKLYEADKALTSENIERLTDVLARAVGLEILDNPVLVEAMGGPAEVRRMTERVREENRALMDVLELNAQ
jgi:hypothetical protein